MTNKESTTKLPSRYLYLFIFLDYNNSLPWSENHHLAVTQLLRAGNYLGHAYLFLQCPGKNTKVEILWESKDKRNSGGL